MRVECVFAGTLIESTDLYSVFSSEWYRGVIRSVDNDGRYQVLFDDGDLQNDIGPYEMRREKLGQGA